MTDEDLERRVQVIMDQQAQFWSGMEELKSDILQMKEVQAQFSSQLSILIHLVDRLAQAKIILTERVDRLAQVTEERFKAGTDMQEGTEARMVRTLGRSSDERA